MLRLPRAVVGEPLCAALGAPRGKALQQQQRQRLSGPRPPGELRPAGTAGVRGALAKGAAAAAGGAGPVPRDGTERWACQRRPAGESVAPQIVETRGAVEVLQPEELWKCFRTLVREFCQAGGSVAPAPLRCGVQASPRRE